MGDILRKITEILSEGNNIEERRGKWIAPPYPKDREFIYKPNIRSGTSKPDPATTDETRPGAEGKPGKNIPAGMTWQEYYEKNKFK